MTDGGSSDRPTAFFWTGARARICAGIGARLRGADAETFAPSPAPERAAITRRPSPVRAIA